MDYFDLTLPTLPENLALDDSLLWLADHSTLAGEVLRFWEVSEYAVVLGAASRIEDDVRLDACREDGVAVCRRSTGGGTVLIGPGCLNVALVLRYGRDELQGEGDEAAVAAGLQGYEGVAALATPLEAAQYVVERFRQALQPLVAEPLTCAAAGDLCVGGRKVGGSAQKRGRRALLYHGTVLYDFDVARIGRYLKMPLRQPEYRANREHDDFVGNLRVAVSEVKRRFAEVWSATMDLREWPHERVRQLVAERFGDPAWTFRR